METCQTLSDYSEYADRVRTYAKVMDLRSAVERAVKECIEEGILKDFLRKNRAEAIEMSILSTTRKCICVRYARKAWKRA